MPTWNYHSINGNARAEHGTVGSMFSMSEYPVKISLQIFIILTFFVDTTTSQCKALKQFSRNLAHSTDWPIPLPFQVPPPASKLSALKLPLQLLGSSSTTLLNRSATSTTARPRPHPLSKLSTPSAVHPPLHLSAMDAWPHSRPPPFTILSWLS